MSRMVTPDPNEFRGILFRKKGFTGWSKFTYIKRESYLLEFKLGANPWSSTPQQIFDLTNCVLEDGAAIVGKELAFILHLTNGNSLTLLAMSKNEKNTWINAIRGGDAVKKATPSTTPPASTAVPSSVPISKGATARRPEEDDNSVLASTGSKTSFTHSDDNISIETKLSPILTAMDAFMDAVVIGGLNGRIVGINSAAEKLFGFSKEESRGAAINMLMPEPYKTQHDSYLFRHEKFGWTSALETGRRPVKGERKDGSIFKVELALRKLPEAAGYFVATFYNVQPDDGQEITLPSAAKVSSGDIITVEAKLTPMLSAMEAFMDPVVIGGLNGRIIGMNSAAEKLFGYSKQDARGAAINMLMPEPFKTQHDSYLFRHEKFGWTSALESGRRPVKGERKDGSTFKVDLALRKVPDITGYYVATFYNVQPDDGEPITLPSFSLPKKE